ncbi:hypothetical protein ICL16_16235 [Iningainema sp. BLCCT55]|uniref:Uncharacterized protein n=1 Tax=Iningainema tapete BLCC-T55 TaxID=2748662 RepID=A0A8J7CEJ0_9CYAN|nr:hypothetical protein [Iningainema tapete BLCC-T55]
MSVQDYRLQKAKEIVTPTEDAQITIDVSPKNETLRQAEIGINSGLSHKEMQKLTNSPINTIRSKASQGKSITTSDGVTYHYNKDPKVLKWVRV